MQDRLPTPGQEGRALITPEDGTAPFYAKISMADNPTQEGTPYDKVNVLQDVTCDAIGIPHTATPNQAFLALSIGVGRYGYLIHLQYPDGTPAVGFTISGVTSPSGGSPITDENGDAIGVSTSQSIAISITSPYIDIQNEDSISVPSSGLLTSFSYTVSPVSGVVLISTSQTVKISPYCKTFDVSALGGGGAGGGCNFPSGAGGGGGGGGGYCQSALNINRTEENELTVTIGAGGQYVGNIAGPSGGTTSVVGKNGLVGLHASGGSGGALATASYANFPGGTGNGDGGQGGYVNMSGQSGTTHLFDDETQPLTGGGGGGGFYSSSGTQASGGAPNGAIGSIVDHNAGQAGPGGGGGGASRSGNYQGYGSSGGNGATYFRFTH